MPPKYSFRVNVLNVDEEITQQFNSFVLRAFERWKASKWVGSRYASTAALMAFLSDEIPEKFQWEPVNVASSHIPIAVLTGYTPDLEEVLGLQGEFPKGLN